MPAHPFFEETQSHPRLQDYISLVFKSFIRCLYDIVCDVSREELYAIMSNLPSLNSQREFRLFLQKYIRATSHKGTQETYVCLFLTKIEFGCIKPAEIVAIAVAVLLDKVCTFQKLLRNIGNAFYHQINAHLARNALRDVWPEAYNQIAGSRGYHTVIKAYEQLEKLFEQKISNLNETGINRQEFRRHIQDALSKPQILNSMSPINLAILQAFSQDLKPCRPLFELVFIEDIFSKPVILKHEVSFWSGLLNDRFYEFADANIDRANKIISEIIVPSHPFALELQSRLYLDFSQGSFERLQGYVDEATHEILKEQWAQIFEPETLSHPSQRQFNILLQKYKKTYCTCLEHKYVFTFLTKLPFHQVKAALCALNISYVELLGDPSQFSAHIYAQVSRLSVEKAQKALESTPPSAHPKGYDRSYHSTIEAFVKSGREPLDCEEFRLYIL